VIVGTAVSLNAVTDNEKSEVPPGALNTTEALIPAFWSSVVGAR